mgnify:CR=1 FL=1
MPWIFWMVMAFVVLTMISRRARRRQAGWGPGGPWEWSQWDERRRGRVDRSAPAEPRLQKQLADQQDSIETLESRINELENRLDFTERLLIGRHQEPQNDLAAAPSASDGRAGPEGPLPPVTPPIG